LRSLCRKSLGIVGISSIVLTAAAIIFAAPISDFFIGYDTVLSELARHAFALYSISFVFCGFNIWCSGFFTALNNGFVSAAIAFGRTFLFQGLAIIILPYLFGLNGVWTAMIAAEALAFIVTLLFFIRQKRKYQSRKNAVP
jgi:Na+-driven multidrug efflux pump